MQSYVNATNLRCNRHFFLIIQCNPMPSLISHSLFHQPFSTKSLQDSYARGEFSILFIDQFFTLPPTLLEVPLKKL
jgi:hypothetical protein